MNCYNCRRYSKTSLYEYSCNHMSCYNCLIGSIISEQINKITFETNDISIDCKCMKGSVTIPFKQLKTAPLAIYENAKVKCAYHNLEYQSYCRNCKELLCKLCYSTSHQEHDSILLSDFKIKLFSSINPQYKTFDDFWKTIEKIQVRFLDKINTEKNNQINQLNSLIAQISKLKEKIKQQMELQINKEEIILHLIKNCYKNAYNDLEMLQTCENWTALDFYSIKALRKIKFNIDDLLIEKKEEIQPEVNIIDQHIQMIIDKKNINVKITYPYFGIVKEFYPLHILDNAHTQNINCVVEVNNNMIATASNDSLIKLFAKDDSNKGYRLANTLSKHSGVIHSLIYFSNRNELISGGKDTYIRVWSLDPFAMGCIQEISQHMEEITALTIVKKDMFASGSEDATIRIWKKNDNANEYILNDLLDGHESGITSLVELDKGELLSGSNDMTVLVWKEMNNVYNCSQIISGFTSFISSLCEYKGNILVGLADSSIKIYEYGLIELNEEDKDKEKEIEEPNKGYKLIETINIHRKMINFIIQLKDNRFASCSFDKTIKIFSYNQTTKEYKCDQTLTNHSLSVYGLCELNDGRLVSVSADKRIILWKRVKKQ